jgi:hypothetical protein
MFVYNWAIAVWEETYPASTIYSVVYFFYIPLGHALSCLLVFGWPKTYLPNLLSNYPIGITAIFIGAALTAYLDHIHFEDTASDWIHDTFTGRHDEKEEKGEFYSSFLVLIVTSVWTYVLSCWVNAPPPEGKEDEKKEL